MTLTSPTQELASFSADLAFEHIPSDVREIAARGIVDTIAVCLFGATLPWTKSVIDYACRYGQSGSSIIFGTPFRVAAPFAALANGTSAHAFEMDNLRQPSVGVHPGATLVPTVFAIGEELGASGRDVLTAYVAGFEVMSRIGSAAHNTPEKIGFHSPALTGTFGATVAAAKLLKLDSKQTANSLGIAGSLCSGILAFAKAGSGGMVKRLHMGRAAEGGILAARLAADGFAGPETVLEGQFGFFDCFARDPQLEKLLAGLGEVWEVSKTCTKRYPAHITAHTPLQALEDIRKSSPFDGRDILEIKVATSEKVLSHHANPTPKDIATAQYSVPFCLAIAAYRDANDPQAFLDNPQADDKICDLAGRVRLTLNEEIARTGNDWATRLTVILRDGRELVMKRTDFSGAPSSPMAAEAFAQRFRKLAAHGGSGYDSGLFERLSSMENIKTIRSVFP